MLLREDKYYTLGHKCLSVCPIGTAADTERIQNGGADPDQADILSAIGTLVEAAENLRHASAEEAMDAESVANTPEVGSESRDIILTSVKRSRRTRSWKKEVENADKYLPRPAILKPLNQLKDGSSSSFHQGLR